jgi:hypothetical protein
MIMTKKTPDTLTVRDFQEHPVWRFGRGDAVMVPVSRLPCTTLDGRIVGTRITLADATIMWGALGNIDVAKPDLTKHFLILSIEFNGAWFHLARYHDYDFNERGPVQLSEFLRKPIDQIFPITYDVRSVFKTESEALRGKIERESSEKFTRAELIAMAVS